MKKIALLTIVLTLTFFGQNALSFGLPDMPAVPGIGATKSVETGPLVAQLNEVLLNLSISQEHIFLALKKPKEAAEAKSVSEELGRGSITSGTLEKTDEANKAIKDIDFKAVKLTDEGKKEIALALPPYGVALLRSAGLAVTLTAAAQSITANPMAVVGGALSVPELITIFTKAPSLLGDIVGQGYDLATFAGENGIEHPSMKGAGSDVGKGK